MRFTSLLAVALSGATLAGCTDEPVAVMHGDGRVVLTPSFSYSGSTASRPIEVVRLVPGMVDGPLLGEPIRVDVEPDDPTWEIRVPLDLGERDSALIEVRIEMLSVATGSEIVEWSGLFGPLMVYADRANPIEDEVALTRGPIENQLVADVLATGPSLMNPGQTQPAYALVETAGNSHTVLWTSSNEGVVTVDPVGDSVDVHATGAGVAEIVAAAGAHADTLVVLVNATTGGAVAQVIAFPDSAVMVVSATRAWEAIAVDSVGIAVNATLAWETLDPTIATVSTTGVVGAQATGRARIIVSASGFADTAIVNVQPRPAGVDLVWQGGTPGAAEDWFTADNWSPVRVPTASDVIYVPGGSESLWLNANAEVGGILTDSTAAYVFDIGANTLTVHGDVIAPFGIFGDSSALLRIDAVRATLAGTLPATEILGLATLGGDVVMLGGLIVSDALRPAGLDLNEKSLLAQGDARFTNANLTITVNDTTGARSLLQVAGDLTVDGGNSSTTMTGGSVVVRGQNFTVTAASCTAYAPTGTETMIYSDSIRIDVGCSASSGNSFSRLYLFPATTPVVHLIELVSNVHVREDILTGASSARIEGNGHTLFVAWGDMYRAELNQLFLEIETADASEAFFADSISFTGMAGQTRAQLTYRHPGEGCQCLSQNVQFDRTAAGPYLHAVDNDSIAPFFTLVMEQNPGDGPARTVTEGGAQVRWAGVPFAMRYWAGNAQSGPSNQPLADSLTVQVYDYLDHGVAGQAVQWQVTAGNGSVSPASSVTDAGGFASTQFTIGDTTQLDHRVAASTTGVPGDTVVFSAFPSGAPGGIAHGPDPLEATPMLRSSSRPTPPRVERPELRIRPDRPAPRLNPAERP